MRRFLAALVLTLFATSAFASTTPKKSPTPDAALQAFVAAWNQHDVKTMASCWTDDATLINPMGRVAHGKAEIEKLMSDEQTTVFKASTANLLGLKVTRSLGSSMVFCDGEMTVDGAVGPDGAAMPQMKVHLAVIMSKKGSSWMMSDARPYQFVPSAPADAGAAKN